MAKKLKLGKQDLHYGAIIVNKLLNTRPESEYGDAKDVIDSMARGGFSDNFNVNCFEATEEDAAKEIELRKAVMLELDNQRLRKEDAARMFTVLERLYKDEKGHWIEPQVFNNMAFRRLTNYPQAMIQRAAMAPEDRGGPSKDELLPMIPVNIKVYDSDYERILDQLAENGTNKQGAKDLSFLSKCKACKPLMKNPRVREADIVNALGGQTARGTGQKVYNLLIVDMRCPEAELLERGALDPKDSRYLRLESPKYADWQKLHKNGNRPSVEDVEAIFDKPEGNAPKVLEGKAIRHFADNIVQDEVTRNLFSAVVKGDADGLSSAYTKYQPILKEVARIEKLGRLPEAYAILKEFGTAPAPESAQA